METKQGFNIYTLEAHIYSAHIHYLLEALYKNIPKTTILL